MGKRGPLPAVKTLPARKLADLTPPPWLTDEAKAHWTRHAAPLSEAGLLTDRTADNFAVVCALWGMLQTLDPSGGRVYLDTAKAYATHSKPFRMIPCDKPAPEAPEDRHGKREFRFDG